MLRRAGALALLLLPAATEAKKEVFAWASGGHADAVVAQLHNASFGFIDGVHTFCSVDFQQDSSSGAWTIGYNATEYAKCLPIQRACKALKKEFHVCLGRVPTEMKASDEPALLASAVAMAKQHGWDGYNIDDESECAPRADLANFTTWIALTSKMADALHAASPRIALTADVQAIFGIEDAPYVPKAPGKKAPWDYKPNPQLVALLQGSSMDRFAVMDTYYFTLNRFYDTLDWHAAKIPAEKLGIGMMNRADINTEGWLARFHALHTKLDPNVSMLNLFVMPLGDEWLPWVERWKSNCAGCPNSGALSCYEPSVTC